MFFSFYGTEIMAHLMKGARILSSDATNGVNVKQTQNTTITLKSDDPEVSLEVVQPQVTAAQVSPAAERDIDLTVDITDKEKQIEILELLLQIYENNPLIVNKFVVCKGVDLVNLIKLITNADKVELMLSEDFGCTCGSNKYVTVDNIFITKGGKSVEFQQGFNDKYTLLLKHSISLKLIV